MEPIVKVLIVAVVVVVVVHIAKTWLAHDDVVATLAPETYIPWIQQEFATVPPQDFVVPNPPLVVSGELTAPPATLTPVLTQVATSLPAVAPTMVPTYVPTGIPASQAPTLITTLPASLLD